MTEDKLLQAGGEVREGEKPSGITTKKTRSPLLFIGAAIILIVLALALGLGLGLGLKHKKASAGGRQSSNGTSPNSTSGTSPDISENRPLWRRDPLEYVLDRSWDINAAPTTRVFNLTVSEIQAAPDGNILHFQSASMTSLTCTRCNSTTAGYQWTVSWSPHSGKPRRPSSRQCDKPAIKWDVDALARLLPKWDELDGWNSRNNSMCNSSWHKLPV